MRSDGELKDILSRHVSEIIIYLVRSNRDFSVVAKVEDLSFMPKLPSKIYDRFGDVNMLYLNEYSTAGAEIINNVLIFETSFGEDFFISKVSIHLLNIIQILVEENCIYINSFEHEGKIENSLDNSMTKLLSKEKNRDIFSGKQWALA